MAIVVDVVSASSVDWAAVAAAGATVVAAVGGIWGTARQAKNARETATEDLKTSLAVAQENLRLSIAAENERNQISEKNRSYDARQQRITELYSNAVEQLGHDKAPVRLGGFYALERLAQDNPEHRQTVVDVVCAYLRMPFGSEPQDTGVATDSDRYQELQVRLAAQNLLTRHLEIPMVPSREKGIAFSQPARPPSSYWKNISLDLTRAHLISIDFTLCVLSDANFNNAIFEGETKFWNTRFEGSSLDFGSARFLGIAGFGRAKFVAEGYFLDAEFHQAAEFARTYFDGSAFFDGAKFMGSATFDEAEFSLAAVFDNAEFDEVPQFCMVQFGGPNRFDATVFKAGEPDLSGSTISRPNYDQHWPLSWQVEKPAKEGDLCRVVRRSA
jgi:uncharacterized protein YjbI with pentapeptide repeats